MEEEELFRRTLGRFIRLRRIEKHLTLAELAENANLDGKHLGKVERGKHTLNSRNLRRLCKSLNMSMDRLLEKVEKEMSKSEE